MESFAWQSILKYDPIAPLAHSGDKAILFFTNEDLHGIHNQNRTALWDLPLARQIVRKQQANGSWKYPGGNHQIRASENYDQLETFRNLGYLVEMFGFDTSSSVITKAANFILSFQTSAGDIRGILGSQYTPYYTAGMLELLIKAGYADDPRVHKAFGWLKLIRQDDGGWAIPLRTLDRKLDLIAMNAETLEPDKSKPFSHLVTGVVLRAYAAHHNYRQSEEAKKGGELLLSRLFKKDGYTDRGAPEFWLRFTYPFWFTDLLSAVDSLSKLGFSKDEPQMRKAIEWFVANQNNDGLWKLKTLKNQKKFATELWISLSICRVLKRLYE